MRKIMRILPAILMIVVCVVAFAACNDEHVHDWSEWTVEKVATCTEAGEEARSCSCGERETRTIAEAGHKCGAELTNAATLMQDGQKYKICSVCDERIVTETLPRLTSDIWDGTTPTDKPATYITDGAGNISLYGVAAFAWFAHLSQTETFDGKTITLYTDINLDSHQFTPLFDGATANADGTENAFEGTFDGGEYTISNLSITAADKKILAYLLLWVKVL